LELELELELWWPRGLRERERERRRGSLFGERLRARDSLLLLYPSSSRFLLLQSLQWPVMWQ
jgi:hypothetical protein